MYQVVQDIRSGELRLADVPPPSLAPGGVLVRTHASLISAGTERQIIDLASKSLVGKAQARPDLAKRVVDKALKEGWQRTLRQVMEKLDRPFPLGYSAAGVVEAVADDVDDFRPGDRVAVAGQGHASHAEVNLVPKNLVAHMPDEVTFEQAAYTTISTIALQGVRLTRPALGEFVAVSGLGLVGLVTVQLLVANGCRVIGIDPNGKRRELGRRLGLEAAASPDEAANVVDRMTKGHGVDHTIIAAATPSNEPVEQAGELTRKQGSVVVVGLVGMDIPREPYFSKELTFQISLSYGPGRYDPTYEQGGIDYPYDYVRWTEGRNMEAALALMASGRLDVDVLTTDRIAITNALDAYALIQNGDGSSIGVLLEYPAERPIQATIEHSTPKRAKSGLLGVSFIGAGSYAASMLLPAVQKTDGLRLEGLVTATGANAEKQSKKFGFRFCSTDPASVIDNDKTDLIFIATRHSTHAELATRALTSGKHVFVEKPLVTTPEELAAVAAAESESPGSLTVGLNRRFAPLIRRVKREMRDNGPLQTAYRVNAGHIPPDSWVQREKEGGGMLVGEMIHFIDVMQYLTGERPKEVVARAMRLGSVSVNDRDNLVITVSFDAGSIGALTYSTLGDKSAPKERIEVFGGGCFAVVDDFRRIEITRNGKTSDKTSRMDKGQKAMLKALFESIRDTGESPIRFEELHAGMQVIFAAAESLRTGDFVEIDGSTARK